MSEAIKRRRGTTAEHATFTGLEGEITVDTTKKTAVVHDGVTAGGFPLARADEVDTELASIAPSLVTPTDLPFGRSGIRLLVGQNQDAHYGFNSAIFDIGGGKWTIVYRKGSEHNPANGSEIWAVDTFDEGATLENARLIYTDPNYDTRNFVGRTMANGRVGIVCSKRSSVDLTYADGIFIYSDNGGVTWSTAAITAPSAGWPINFHGHMIDYPASVGGSDTEGFIAYSYSTPDNGGHIDALKTVDNGNTWTWQLNVASRSGAVTVLTEPACSRVGTQNKWIMYCRTSGQDNAVAFVGSSPLSFGSQQDSGLSLKNNPPQTVYDPETNLFWLIGFFRRDRGVTVDGVNVESAMAVASADADALYAASGNLGSLTGNWTVSAYIPDWASGYIFPFRLGGRWFATFVMGEDYATHSYSKLALIGDFVAGGLEQAKVANEYGRSAQQASAGGESGTWLPTLTSPVNVASSTAFDCLYARIGDVVYCSGYVNITPAAASDTATSIRLSLPIPSTFDGMADGRGVCGFYAPQRGGEVSMVSADGTAILRFRSQVTTALSASFTFTYRVK